MQEKNKFISSPNPPPKGRWACGSTYWSKKEKLNLLLQVYNKFKTNFEIMKLSVYNDVFHSYQKENPVIPNFPFDIIGIFRTIKLLDAT